MRSWTVSSIHVLLIMIVLGFFFRLNWNVDLSFVDNGEFLRKLNTLQNEAVKNKIAAQKKELVSENVEDVFSEYEKAYNSYATVYNLIQDSMESINFLRHKAVLKERLNTAFGIVGVTGLFLTILFRFV